MRGIDGEEHPPAALLDRLAFHVELDGVRGAELAPHVAGDEVAMASERLPEVIVGDEAIEALCGAALALGIASLNAPILAVKAARALAALEGETHIAERHVAIAAGLVLAPRAMLVPALEECEPDVEPGPADADRPDEQQEASGGKLSEVVLAAAQAAIPPQLLARLMQGRPRHARGPPHRAGLVASQQTPRRGRPAGTRRGALRSGARLSVVETLRAAAPWQRLRRRAIKTLDGRRRIEVRQDDFRIKRFKQKNETVTLFVVDASGSSALHRLAEAKGAVELLLADCYVRRDQVALLAFGGRGVELLLPPTRSLTRAKRRLADLPGGGGTPLGAALEQAAALADAIRRKHQTPAIVVLTDGRPNLARDGRQGRQAGEEDALTAAQAFRASGFSALLIDTSRQADASAARIAAAMGAHYVALPHADARMLSDEVRARMPGANS